MAFIKGYKYYQEQEAKDAVSSCNVYYNIQVKPENVTTSWVDYKEANGFWFIIYDDSLLPVLGQPIEFEINDNS